MVHIPVLLKDVLENLPQQDQMHFGLDATFGRGGHTQAILSEYPGLTIIGLDRDIEAIHFGKANFNSEVKQNKLKLIHAEFLNSEAYKDTLPEAGLSFILVDLGVSSPQLDQAERGFSFYQDGPLDMRMNQDQELTAADIVNFWDEEELISTFKEFGEVRSPYKIVKAILHDRKIKKFETTRDLAGMIERVNGWSQKGKHPATKFFLALRLVVNDELGQIENMVEKFINFLDHDGRLLVISFHSLEDRIVKNKFKEYKDLGKIITKKVIQATWDEKKTNPRSRSAKLRVFERHKS
jgi:16S rRNA (cytosine1402-N4)-methyltransferase